MNVTNQILVAPSFAVQEISPEEYEKFLRDIEDPSKNSFSGLGVRFEGQFHLKCRELPTKAQIDNGEPGELVWEADQKNLVTDFGRRRWMEEGWGSASNYIFVSPSTEVPVSSRYSLLDLGGSTQANSQSQWASPVAPSNNSSTLTRSWSPSALATPPSTRTIATIGLCTNGYVNVGPLYVMSFSLISPAKTQTTTQTLEVVYSLQAIVTL
jgi:hypothetical protein